MSLNDGWNKAELQSTTIRTRYQCLLLTLKRQGHFFHYVISFFNDVHNKCNSFVWNWPNTMNISSALWVLMAWCFSNRASVARVLSTHSCISQCLRLQVWSDIHLSLKYIFVPQDSVEIKFSLWLQKFTVASKTYNYKVFWESQKYAISWLDILHWAHLKPLLIICHFAYWALPQYKDCLSQV